jgi:hypothetical protein
MSAFLMSCLAGCSVLDPDGEWRGRPLVRPVDGPATMSVSVSVSNAEQAQQQGIVPREGHPESRTINVARTLVELESAYSAADYQLARRLIDDVLAAQPDQPQALLRQANLLHRQGEHEAAMRGYRRVLEVIARANPSDSSKLAELRARANANLAILSVEQARRALDALEESSADGPASAHRARIETALRVLAGRTEPERLERPAGGPFSRTAAEAPPTLTSSGRPMRALGAAGEGAMLSNVSSSDRPPVEMIRGLSAK